MTDSHPEKTNRVRPNEFDPEELQYLRARYLSELADWILNHPVQHGLAGSRPAAAPLSPTLPPEARQEAPAAPPLAPARALDRPIPGTPGPAEERRLPGPPPGPDRKE